MIVRAATSPNLRPGGHPRPGRLGARLLRGARHHPCAWRPCPGVQGLHRDAEVQLVSVAAHDGHRAGGQARRAADPHRGDAPARRIRHRGALEVQGGRAAARPGQGRRHGLAAPAARLAEGGGRPGEFLDSLRFDLHSTEVFVFTPKGDVVPLVSGATAVDLAYAVHTEVGHRCIGARVNGRLVALESVLENGDVVEIFTSKAEGAGPSRDWLGFVKSPRARNKIRQWFAKERREDAVEAGKEAISRAVRKQGLPLQRLLGGDVLPTVASALHLSDVTALYVEVGEGRVSAQSVVARVMAGDGRHGGRRRGHRRDRRPDPGAAHQPHLDRPGRRRQGRVRHLGQARPLLHARAR